MLGGRPSDNSVCRAYVLALLPGTAESHDSVRLLFDTIEWHPLVNKLPSHVFFITIDLKISKTWMALVLFAAASRDTEVVAVIRCAFSPGSTQICDTIFCRYHSNQCITNLEQKDTNSLRIRCSSLPSGSSDATYKKCVATY